MQNPYCYFEDYRDFNGAMLVKGGKQNDGRKGGFEGRKRLSSREKNKRGVE